MFCLKFFWKRKYRGSFDFISDRDNLVLCWGMIGRFGIYIRCWLFGGMFFRGDSIVFIDLYVEGLFLVDFGLSYRFVFLIEYILFVKIV